MENKEYFLGLDIGTDSVGFAVTDLAYNVIKKGKKEIIGTRLFESGNTAEERRGFRSQRRRTQRNRERIGYLRELFNEEVSKIDPQFFMRLDESMYHSEDKESKDYNSLFNDIVFKDKEYFKKYPTIYHLRKALIKGEVEDVRLLYLGLAHIIKSRGHFLFQGVEFGNITNFEATYSKLEELLIDEYSEFNLNILDKLSFETILRDRTKGISSKEKSIYSLIQSKVNVKQKNLVKLILGSSLKLSKLFDDLDDDIANKNITFKGDYEKLYAEIEPKLDDKIILIDIAKALYDWSVLIDILDCPITGNEDITISDAKINKYNIHNKDLILLKKIIKKYIPDKYEEVFQLPNQKANYPAYVGKSMKNGKKLVIENKICSQEEFCTYIKNLLKDIEFELNEEKDFFEKLVLNIAFPKQKSKENSVIPYQIHKKELEMILVNNKDKFHFLLKTENGISVTEKIEMIFMYRIPYYVGPLNSNSGYSWIVKNLEEKIYPWNFETVVNLEDSAEGFIRRMTNKCTYLRDKDVIPQKSILYSRFMVLNELNNLRLDGELLSVELKQELYERVFKANKKVTQKRVKQYLIKNCYADVDIKLTGIDNDFKSSLETYIDFSNIFGENFDENMAEDIIKWITLFSEDKNMLKRKILSKYNLLEEDIKKVIKLKYSGWGRLSKEFLSETNGCDIKTGEAMSIIEALYNTNNNLMQLLSKEYTYIEQINSNKQAKQDITLDDIKELYCSPAVKKSIWQAIKIAKEIEHIMKSKPNKLFIEVTRAEGEKIRTSSRHKDLSEKYSKIKKEYVELYNALGGKKESDLRQKKLYLYFTQLGKCAYTGVDIDLESLNSNIYDIEHIYPRSKTKDDSIHNNLVLVYKEANEDKTDKYPIPNKYRQETLWKLWLEKELINKTKFERLMRTTEFEPRELEGFIARQLVETSQASKAVAELFENYYENSKSKVVYVKAGNVSDFRHHFDIVKVREINDYHHAHDAYLNIVVGNVWDTKFTKKFFNKMGKYSLKPELLYPVKTEKYGDFAWQTGEHGSIKVVKDTIYNSKILFTRHSYKASGKLFDDSHAKKNTAKGSTQLPIKESIMKMHDLTKYGSYKSIKPSYFVLVEYAKGKSKIRELISIPIVISKLSESNLNRLNEWIESEIGTGEFKIFKTDIKINSLVRINGALVNLSGGKDVKNAMQLDISFAMQKYLKKLYKCVQNKYISNKDDIDKNKNLEIYDLCTFKLTNTIYSKVSKHKILGEFLIQKRDKFCELDTLEQITALKQVLEIFKCKAGSADLRLIGGVERANRLNISLKINKQYKTFELINQSITGMYTNEVDLLSPTLFD